MKLNFPTQFFKSSLAKCLLALPVFFLPKATLAEINYWKIESEDTATIPKTLSAMGIFSNITAQKITFLPSINHFEVNAPLWSDGAHKNRWFLIKPGAKIGFKLSDDYYDYPDSAIFIKQFDIDTIPGESASRVRWETRILYNIKEVADSNATTGKIIYQDHWYGYTYKWNAAQTDADLVKARGTKDSIRFYPNGISKPSAMKKWAFPSRLDCNRCHVPGFGFSNNEFVHARSVLGFFTAQLNRPHPDSAGINQLEYFFQKGLFTGTKPTNWNYFSVPRWARIDDSTASIDVRARSYIAANCSGCHGDRGIANNAPFSTNINYDFHTMYPQMEFRQRIVKNFPALDTTQPLFYRKKDAIANPLAKDTLRIIPALTIPGYPSKSVIVYRQESRDTVPGSYNGNTNQMPPLASFEVNRPAMSLLRQWISEMAPVLAPHANEPVIGINLNHYSVMRSPIIEGNQLRLPYLLINQGNVKVTMTNVLGQKTELKSLNKSTFEIPSHLNRGVYILQVGNEKFTQYLF